MTKRLTMKRLAEDLDTVRQRIGEIETKLERQFLEVAGSAKDKIRDLVGPAPVDAATRENLIREAAYFLSQGYPGVDPAHHWVTAERIVDRVLELLGRR